MFRIDRNLVSLSEQTIVIQNIPFGSLPPERTPRAGDLRPESNAFAEPPCGEKGGAEDDAEQRVAAAQGEAELMVKLAHMEALDIRKQAWNDGYVDGKCEWEQAVSKLRAEDQERQLSQSAQLARALHDVHAARSAMIDELETELLELALAIAQKIIHIELDQSDKAFEGILQSALIQMKREGKVTIRLSDADFERYFPDGTATFRLGDEAITAAVQGDSYLRAGDCLMESEGETINCGVHSQLKAVRVAFETSKGQEG